MTRKKKPRKARTHAQRSTMDRIQDLLAEALGPETNQDKIRKIMATFGPPQPSGCVDPRTLGGQIAGPGGPHDRGAVLIDPTDCVLLESMDACVIERVLNGSAQGDAIFMTLNGRVNKTTRQVQAGYIFEADGAAAIITELLALADRCGPAMLTAMVDRLVDLGRSGTADLAWLRGAIDASLERL